MSNHVYGYATVCSATDRAAFSNAASTTCAALGLGYTTITDAKLFNFPADHMPSGEHVSFRVSDGPDTNTASYLIDFENYSADANIALPRDGEARFRLLLDLLNQLTRLAYVNGVKVAMTDCEEIDEVVHLSSRVFASRMLADMDHYAPPNKLYVVTSDQ